MTTSDNTKATVHYLTPQGFVACGSLREGDSATTKREECDCYYCNNRKDDPDRAVEFAKRLLREDYYTSVRSTAEDIRKRIASGEIENEADLEGELSEDPMPYWVTYTHAALHAVYSSDNWQAFEDFGLDLPGNDIPRAITMIAAHAIERDLREAIGDTKELFEIGVEDEDDEEQDEEQDGNTP